MSHVRIRTERLDLVAATAETARAEIDEGAAFARLIGARTPARWPPPLSDEASMQWSCRYLADNPDAVGFGVWYVLLREGGGAAGASERAGGPDRAGVMPLPIGNGGFKGKPSLDGTVEIGYSLFEERQGKGYGTELVRALVDWAFGHARIARVLAETLPHLAPSRRVLEKNGFRLLGADPEEGVIRYELGRPTWAGMRR